MQDQDPWELNYAPAAAAPPLTTGYTVKGLTGTEPKIQLGPISGTNTPAAELDPWEKEYQRPLTPAPRDPRARVGDAVANFAKNFWGEMTQTGQGMIDMFTHNPLDTVKAIGASQDAIRQKAQAAMQRGDYTEAARHAINFMIPMVGPSLDVRGDQAQRGDVIGSAGGTLAIATQMFGPNALESAAPAVAEAASRVGPAVRTAGAATKAAVQAGGRDVVVGAGKTAFGAALAKAGPLGEIGDVIAGVPIIKTGVKQMGRGVRAGYSAGKAALAETPAPEVPPAPAVARAPVPAGAPTDEALVHLYSVETDPAKRSALRAELVDRGVINETATPAPEANPYRGYSQDALQKVYVVEPNAAKRALIEQAARDRNLTLLNREGRRATAAVPETGAPEAPGPSLTQDDALILRYLGEADPLAADADTIEVARKLAAEKPELLQQLRAGGVEPFGPPSAPAETPAPAAAAEPTLAEQELERATRPGASPRVMSPADAAQAFPEVYGQPPAAEPPAAPPAAPAAPQAAPPPAAAPTPGQVFAESQGLEWAKLSASDRQSLEHVARAQENVAAQQPAAPPVTPVTPITPGLEKLTNLLAKSGVTTGMLDTFEPHEWNVVADLAKVDPPSAADIQAIRGKLAEYEGATQITARTPAEAAAEFQQKRDIRNQRKGPEEPPAEPPAAAPPVGPEPTGGAPAAPAAAVAAKPENIYAKNARLAKAVRVADAAAEQGMTSSDVYKMKPDDFARKVGEKSISGDTMAMVVDKLRRREADLERIAAAPEGIHATLDSAAEAALERMRKRGTFTGSKLSAGIPVDDLADMAIWGASKLAKGTIDFAKWSKEILAEAGPAAGRIAPELPKLYAKAQKILERHIATTAGALPNTQKLLDMYRKGIEGQDWYRSTKAELQSVFGPDTDKFVDFLAATSPNTTVAANTSLALKAYMQWKTGQPFTGYLPETIKSLNKAAAGEDFGALKVKSFRKNLHGDPIPVTVDRWIARALGFGDQPTPPQYKFMDYLISQVAAKKGLEPRQVQAAIWKTIKDAEGLAGQGGESYEVLVRRKLLKDPDLAAVIKQVSSTQ